MTFITLNLTFGYVSTYRTFTSSRNFQKGRLVEDQTNGIPQIAFDKYFNTKNSTKEKLIVPKKSKLDTIRMQRLVRSA